MLLCSMLLKIKICISILLYRVGSAVVQGTIHSNINNLTNHIKFQWHLDLQQLD